ncbi:hypothetical protein ON010_g18726 [Phytophthora cinnamomi]|nr:hypothetical protein ON010_g18726 [Phytophthora cinnamomi]
MTAPLAFGLRGLVWVGVAAVADWGMNGGSAPATRAIANAHEDVASDTGSQGVRKTDKERDFQRQTLASIRTISSPGAWFTL